MIRPLANSRPPLAAASVVALLLSASAAPVAADPFYSADLYNHNNFAYLMAASGSTPPQLVEGSIWYGNSHTVVRTVAYPGSLSADLDVTSYPVVQVGMSSTAAFEVDDLVISDGTGVPKPVTVYVQVDVTGVTSYTTSGHDENVTYNGASLRVRMNSNYLDSSWSPVGGLVLNSYPSSGVFTGMSDLAIAGTFLVGPFNLTTEQNNTFEIRCVAAAGPYTAWGEMQGQVTFVVNLARAVPAIVVPSGFVANSTQSHVVDNWFVGDAVSVGESAGENPGIGVELAQNSPNPFSGGTDIEFRLSRPGPVRIEVYAANGRRVAELVNEERSAGRHVVRWDGRDAAGRSVTPGVYFYAIEARGERIAKRMALLR